MRRYLRTLAVLLLPILLLSACWQDDPEDDSDFLPMDEEEESTPSDEHVILPAAFSLPYVPDQTLDPLTCPDGMQQVIGSLIYEGLFQLDHQLQPQPSLCSSYTYDPATFTYVFQLRPGVSFSDGSPLTGSDVKASLNRAKSSIRYQSRLARVSKISATDTTVTVSLTSPNTGFPAMLDIPIIKAGTEKQAAPLGTGPYFFSPGEPDPSLVANQTWWQGDTQPVDRIHLTETSDWDTMLYRFTSHDVQLISADLTGSTPITATGNTSFQDADTTTLQFIGCNTTKAPLNDPAFRRVLLNGFNRSTVISAFLSAHGKATQFPVSPVSPFYPTELEQRYSREAVSAALAESGYTPGRTLTLLVNSENQFKVSIADFIAKSLSSSGIPVTIRTLPWAEYVAALHAGNFDLYYGEVRLTADWNLAPLLASGGSLNYSRWADPITDQLLAAFAAAPDQKISMEALCKHLQAQAPILPVCFKSTTVLMQTDVLEGLAPTAAQPFYQLGNCKIHLS